MIKPKLRPIYTFSTFSTSENFIVCKIILLVMKLKVITTDYCSSGSMLQCWVSFIKEKSHAHDAHGTTWIWLCFSDFIDLSNLTHQHFHLDITDKLFILVAVAKSKDLAARNSLSSEGGHLLKKQSTIIPKMLPCTNFKPLYINVHCYLCALW